jgi:16S rRNA processing protein RimM
MMQEELFGIGKFAGTFGVQGQLVLQHSLGKKTTLKGLEVLMVEVKRNELLPFFVLETKIKNETEVYIRLEEINNREQAQKLVSRPVWLKETDFKKFVSQSANISLLGYTLFNREQKLSEIIEVIEQPHQVLAKINYLEKEMLIPVHQSFILSTDTKNKKLVLDLPDGLLDIYL